MPVKSCPEGFCAESILFGLEYNRMEIGEKGEVMCSIRLMSEDLLEGVESLHSQVLPLPVRLGKLTLAIFPAVLYCADISHNAITS